MYAVLSRSLNLTQLAGGGQNYLKSMGFVQGPVLGEASEEEKKKKEKKETKQREEVLRWPDVTLIGSVWN